MPSRRLRSAAALAAVVTVFATGLQTDAAVQLEAIQGGGTALRPAVPVELPFESVSIYQTGELTAAVRDAALAAARDAGVPAAVGRGFTALMTRVTRGTTVVQQSSGTGWAFPMAVTVLPYEAVGPIMGRDVAAVLAGNRIVMSQTTANIRGARAGDTVELVASSGGRVRLVIGRIAPDAEVGGTELVLSIEQANRLGATIPTRVLFFGQMDRAAVNRALVNRGLAGNTRVRIRRSWDPADPDNTLSMAQTKRLLGEFDFYYAGLSTLGWTSMNQAWVRRYLPSRDLYPTGIRALCNTAIKADLRAALTEVVNSGLGGYIDAANANRYGGCATGSVRFARITQALGSVSRHSWGQPLDTNTTTNCQGCVPRMDCRIVRIFRKHNFAWGGNFLTPDGMHFEWVGEPRNTLQYPSRYCPNLSAARTQSIGGSSPPTARDTLFADDGFMADDHG